MFFFCVFQLEDIWERKETW